MRPHGRADQRSPRRAAAFSVAAALALGAVIAACAPKPRYSGFLGDYSQLAPDPAYNVALSYRNPGADLSYYKKIMIDPIVILYSPKADDKTIHPEELQALANDFHAALVQQLQSGYPVVDAPGRDVMRLRIAITDLVPSPAGGLGESLPPTRALGAAARAVTGSRLLAGGASMEAEMLDSESGVRLAAVVDSRYGRERLSKPGEWTDAEQAFDYWAKTLRRQLDRNRLTTVPFS